MKKEIVYGLWPKGRLAKYLARAQTTMAPLSSTMFEPSSWVLRKISLSELPGITPVILLAWALGLVSATRVKFAEGGLLALMIACSRGLPASSSSTNAGMPAIL